LDEQPKKVLVVENDEIIIVLISHILKMPNGGVDLIRRIEARNPALLRKIIVVTGALDEVSKVADLPLHAIVKKPFEINALLETVSTCVRRPD
jgi:DNA-binding response OmpR family regulator